jgi:hypothetical protein
VSYINLAAATKMARAAQIAASIGAGGNMLLYTGEPPLSPDYPATGSLLVTLPLSSPPAVASLAVKAVIGITSGGTGGTDGAQLVTGTTGTGTKFQASVTVSDGAIININSVISPGAYSVAPEDLNNEPVTGGGVTGASFSLLLTGQLTFNPITVASASDTGVAGYARVVTADGIGVIDFDCGDNASDAAMKMNTTTITIGGPVICSGDLMVEQ